MRLALFTILTGFFSASMASANPEYLVPLSRIENIVGVAVKFDGYAQYSIPAQSCEPIPLTLVVHLDDLNSKLIPIARASGLERNEDCGNRVSVRDASIWEANSMLAVKVEGDIAREQCTEVLGAMLTATIDSRASIDAQFEPTVQDNRLSLSMVGRPQLNISNDILRGIAEAVDLDDALANRLAAQIQKALAEPEAVLQLPREFTGYELRFEAARIAMVAGRLSLVVTGHSPRRQPKFQAFAEYLGSITGGTVETLQCR